MNMGLRGLRCHCAGLNCLEENHMVSGSKGLISVIIPVYNVEKYLGKCIDSVLAQTYNNFEILLVDDGSIDQSGEICELYKKRDSRISVFHKENGGLSSARNCGLEHCVGDFVFFLDSDDYIDPDCLEYLFEILSKNDCDLAQTMMFEFQEEEETENKVKPEEKMEVLTGKQMCENMCGEDATQYVVAPNKLYKAQLFDGIRFPEGKLHEDEFTTYRVFWKAEKCAVSYVALYNYRKNIQNSITGRKFTPRRLDGAEAMNERRVFYLREGEKILYEKTSKIYYDYLLICREKLRQTHNPSYKREIKNIQQILLSEIPILVRMENLKWSNKTKMILRITCPHLYRVYMKCCP